MIGSPRGRRGTGAGSGLRLADAKLGNLRIYEKKHSAEVR